MFKRKVRLTIGEKEEVVVIENLRIDFDINVNFNNIADRGTIEVYNMNENSRSKIQRDGIALILEVGYEDGNFGMIFSGKIQNVIPTREREDIVTKIYCYDGEQAYRKYLYNKTIKKRSLNQVLTDIAKENGIAIVTPQFENATLENITFTGTMKDTLQTLSKRFGFLWTLSNNVINITKKYSKNVFVISPTTGMIGIPAYTNYGANVSMFINPSIRVGDKIRLESRFADFQVGDLTVTNLNVGDLGQKAFNQKISRGTITGDYGIFAIIYKGSNRDTNFTANLQCRSIIE